MGNVSFKERVANISVQQAELFPEDGPLDLISVIIPVYNTEKYLETCCASVLAQSYKNLEILLIDDGSTDSSGDICRRLEKSDPRVRYIRRENGGVSAARNTGIEAASGKYLFFLDSDDAIHSRLMETLRREALEDDADLAYASFAFLPDEEIDRRLAEEDSLSSEGSRLTMEGDDLVRYFFRTGRLGRVGLLVSRERVGSLRFDLSIRYGEDTLFAYKLIADGRRTVIDTRGWYYYRQGGNSSDASKSKRVILDHLKCRRIMREGENSYGRKANVQLITAVYSGALRSAYAEALETGDAEMEAKLRELYRDERGSPYFSRFSFAERRMLDMYFLKGTRWLVAKLMYSHQDNLTRAASFVSRSFNSLYWTLRRMWASLKTAWTRLKGLRTFCGNIVWMVRNNGLKSLPLFLRLRFSLWKGARANKVGILTFHCSDNYGAMLQAYGLKAFLTDQGQRAEIINYSPSFMTGRHRLIPYYPKSAGMSEEYRRSLRKALAERNFKLGKNFFRKRKAMKLFRKKYLVKGKPKLRRLSQLGRLGYGSLIVGSDQIWNPSVTFGLRDAYFGAFGPPGARSVTAYGASLGGDRLPPEYDSEFSRLISHVDAISLREASAIPYVEERSGKRAEAVCDPVFLLSRELWERTVIEPPHQNYVLLFILTDCPQLTRYAARLAGENRISLLVLDSREYPDYVKEMLVRNLTAGPSEFLGYIRDAEYVLTNSFHALAFSIIFRKLFAACPYSEADARLPELLRLCGLEDRLYTGPEGGLNIDSRIDWEQVERRMAETVRNSGEFLLRHTRPSSADNFIQSGETIWQAIDRLMGKGEHNE